MKEALTFDDVLIVPKFSEVESRKDVSLSSHPFGFPYTDLPVISANMDSVTGSEMARAMISYGATACLHRFCGIEENIKMFKDSMGEVRLPMVSIGLGAKELERAEALLNAGAYNFVIDVAHGASMSVVKQTKALREIGKDHIGIVIGNFATGKSVRDFLVHLSDCNIDGIKAGIGPGASCTTRVKTGAGYPQLSAIMDICDELKYSHIDVIADGGMRTSGDIAKALGAGARMVMLGSMLAGTYEAPGEAIFGDGTKAYLNESNGKYFNHIGLYRDKNHLFKKYRGSASKESYEVQGKDESWRTAEGESFLVPYKGPVKNILQDIEGGLRSAFSYVDAKNLKEFQERVEFVRVTNAGYVEGTAHGKNQ